MKESKPKVKARARNRGRAKRALIIPPTKTLLPSLPITLPIQPRQTAQPTQQAPQDLGRLIVELIWKRVSPGSLEVFKWSEELATSPSLAPEGRQVASFIGGMAFLYALGKLGERLDS
jgi:hypothetical protein